MLPKLIKHFEEIGKHLSAIAAASTNTDADDSDDEEFTADLFSDEANLTKICFGLCLRLIAAMLTWPKFDDAAHQDLLKCNYITTCFSFLSINLNFNVLDYQ